MFGDSDAILSESRRNRSSLCALRFFRSFLSNSFNFAIHSVKFSFRRTHVEPYNPYFFFPGQISHRVFRVSWLNLWRRNIILWVGFFLKFLKTEEAYTAVLRAFKAQSDAISWEKESLITELRKELRVSDDEHRELLGRVNKDDTILRIRDWRQGGESQASRPAPIQPFDVLPSPTFSASRKRQKTFQSYPSIGATGNRSFNNRVVTSGIAANESAEGLVGRKVWTKWPDDNHFYEAIITQYNAAEGRHALVYDQNTASETWEWVDLKEIPPEDIKWDGEESGVSLNMGPGSGSFRGNRRGQIQGGRGRGPRIHQPRRELVPPPPTQQNGGGGGGRRTSSDDIELFNTESLVKEVEKIIDSAHPDPFELDKAKKMLKEHEQALIAAIARLADTSDVEIDGDPPYSHDHPLPQG